MDPLSITASAFGIASFCAKFVDSAARFIVDRREVAGVITEYYETIRHLQSALLNLGEVLEKRPQPLSFELRHYRTISDITQSCQAALERLEKHLPTIPDDPSAWDKTYANLIRSLKSNVIQQTVASISSYTQVLQLSLTTISLGAHWRAQKSQAVIQATIRNLTDSMQSANLGVPRPITTDPGQDRLPEMEAQVAEANLDVARKIQAWRMTAEDVADAVSHYNPDELSQVARSVRHDVSSDSGVDMANDVEAKPFDPDPDADIHPSREIMEHQLEENQKIVHQRVTGGIYLKAAFYQRKAIVCKQKLAEVHKVPFDYPERSQMNEFLVDILLKSDMKENRVEGVHLLEELLLEECNRRKAGQDGWDLNREYRLYHKLGEAYKVDGNLKQAITMLQRAVNGRSRLDPMPTDLVIESAESLAQIHRLNQAFDEAAGCSEWISKVLRPATTSEQVSLPSPETGDIAFAWCKEQGFDVDAHDFSFDVSDSAMGTSPLHRAIKLEKLDVLQQMIGQVGSLEHRDTDFATPLLLAASTCSYRMTRLLLDRGAKVDVCDHSNKTPLHRCQAKVGGVKVARLLLERQPDLVNRVDGAKRTALFMAVENGNVEMAELLLGVFDAKPDVQETYERTALFRACELGNEAMVGLLLKHDAKPNIQGPGLCTPLLAAIDVAVRTERRVAIAGMLRARGADPYMRDADGQNAFDMAGKAGYASELRRLLHTQEPRRMSTSSARSRVSRASSSSTGRSSSRAFNFLKGF